jgi:proline iminopeptidase
MNVPVRGAEIFCTTRGEGPVCLVLSLMGTKPYERQIPETLSGRLKLAFVDVRGGGRSTGDPAGLTFDRIAEDLEAVREALGVPQVAVLGHSILGVLAMEYARRRPESVSHVITAGTPPYGDMARLTERADDFFEKDASEERKRVLRENLAKLPAKATPGEMLLANTPKRFFDPRYDAISLFAGAELRPALLQHVMTKLTPDWDVTAGPAPGVPILLTFGRFDYVVPRLLWDGVVEKLPRATVHVFERSGHQPFVEEPDQFTRVVTEWIDGTR